MCRTYFNGPFSVFILVLNAKSRDYIHGHLSTLLLGIPALKRHPASSVQSCIMQNPLLWSSDEAFLNYYTVLTGKKMLSQTLCACRVSVNPSSRSVFSMFDNMMPQVVRNMNYAQWKHSAYSPLNPEKRLSKSAMEKWLYGLFFIIALPVSRDAMEVMNPVNLPANLTWFLRVLMRLHEVGYPAHNLSNILTSILENRVQTNARIYSSCSLRNDEVETHYEHKRLSTAPFQHDLAVLISMWQKILPFGLLPNSLKSLILIDDISEYQMQVSLFMYTAPLRPVLTIVFFDQKLFNSIKPDMPYPENLRGLLSSDSHKHLSPDQCRLLRDQGVILISTLS